MIAFRIIIDIVILIGCFFAFAGTIGIIRMPDILCRVQSSKNIATLGTLCTLLGTAIFSFLRGDTHMGIKIILIEIFILLTNPIDGHAICRWAYNNCVKDKENRVCDDYRRNSIDE